MKERHPARMIQNDPECMFAQLKSNQMHLLGYFVGSALSTKTPPRSNLVFDMMCGTGTPGSCSPGIARPVAAKNMILGVWFCTGSIMIMVCAMSWHSGWTLIVFEESHPGSPLETKPEPEVSSILYTYASPRCVHDVFILPLWNQPIVNTVQTS